MTLAADIVFEVQSGGIASDNNGGGFDAVSGSPGTDYTEGVGQAVRSWLPAAGTHTNDLSITDASPSVVTSASYNFVAADVGNIINLTAGTNVTVGRYQIMSVAANAATLDRDAMSGAPSADGSGYLGGPLATPGLAVEEAAVDGQKIYVKDGTYTLSTSTPGAGGPVVLATHIQLLIEGYETTRGDLGAKPIIDAGAQTSVVLITADGNFDANQWIINLKVDGNSQSGVSGFRSLDTFNSTFYFCEAVDCPGDGFVDFGTYIQCLAAGCGFGFNSDNDGPRCIDCEAKNSTTDGFRSDSNALWVRCLARDNGGDGFQARIIDHIVDCTAYSNTGDGFTNEAVGFRSPKFVRCLAVNNTGKGFDIGAADGTLINCAAHNNTAGNLEPVEANILRLIGFVTLTGDPFVDAVGGDFRLNNTAGAGAACRGVGGGVVSQTDNIDIGAVQHADAGGGAASILGGGQLTGGFA